MKSFKKKFVLIAMSILLVQGLPLLPMPVLADDGTIKIAGQSVFSITSAADSGTLAKRAETVQNNLDNALVAAQDHTPASVNITYVKGVPVITLGGYQVVTVGTQDAASAKTTPALLANKWADAIRSSLVNQASINSYVAQLSGNYALSAPAATPSPASSATSGAANAATSNPPSNYANPTSYQGGPGNAPPYNAPPNNYPPPSSGGSPGYESYNNNYSNNNNPGSYSGPPGGGYQQGRVVYAPAGQIIPMTLKTEIDSEIAKPGELIEGATTQAINLGESSIPSGTLVIGQVTEAKSGGYFTKSGNLQITFNQLQLPDGSQVPITSHIVGGIGKYAKGKNQDQVEGETWKNKVGSVAFRGLIGAGGGAALGTAVGAIAGGGYGAGAGAWSGAAIGSGVGVADSLILRKGTNVKVPPGTTIQIALDQPVSISLGNSPQPYNNYGSFAPGGSGGGNYNTGSYPANVSGGGGYNGGYNSGGYNNGNSSYGGSSGGSGYNNGYNNGYSGGNNGTGGGSSYSPQQDYNPPPLR